ncbi:uncharacterized protein LOC129151744 [Eptesicus fuscus]|uniref:uncharacterized protein LOC129151744 n=1 Tax=Eptesicus fuscus TaxID=29078 RepID=UPI0024045885|nr:uncharacterized protein LOC129151744 [Eptesicus fuscus]
MRVYSDVPATGSGLSPDDGCGPLHVENERPPTPKHPRFHRQRKVFTRDLDYGAHVNQTGQEHLEPKEAEPKAPAQEADEAPPVTPEVHPEEQDAELEASPAPELSPPPAASPAAAVEPGPAPEETEAPAPLDEEPSLEPMLAPASEEELPVEGPAQGPLVECAHPVPRDSLVSDLFLLFSLFILFLCSLCCDLLFDLFIYLIWGFWGIFAFIIFFF